ncbi:MAG: glycosyltransferase [Lachnospiraceae bacterium]|nr:glycosyltransferase [Lachnospiraceae bacterium]
MAGKKILYIEWKSFGNEDVKEAISALGHELTVMPYSSNDVYHDETLEKKITDKINEARADAVFSSNYYPPVAIACHENNTPYISWVYDNPFVMLYSYTVIFETNHIFVFDKEQYAEFAKNNIKTVHYLPLAAAPSRRMASVNDKHNRDLFKTRGLTPVSRIAFVGSMYDEEHTFYRRIHDISDHSRGYLEGLMAVQSKVYGYNFIKSMMTDALMDEMSKDLPMQPNNESVASRAFLFAEYAINREITARERYDYLTAIGERFSQKGKPAVDLYTQDPKLSIKGVLNHGSIDHIDLAPVLYNMVGINLNITLRSIHSGIPLRAFEILGSGGFLLSNYQADFSDCYVDGEDYVSYCSREDMLDKIEYYLMHDKERREIASNGFKKTQEEHTYERRLGEILSVI